jgi:hypothetical protein
VPLADLDAYKTALGAQRDLNGLNVTSLTTIAGRWSDLWTVTPPVGVAPTTAAAPTRATAGALGQENPAGGSKKAIVSARFSALNAGQYLLIDRLSHQGGLSGTVTTAQTTNLPTAALTRYTSGDGVMLALVVYTQIGTTSTTVSATYTNQAGTGSRVTPLVLFGATGFREAARVILLPLQAGDTGVRSVQSVTVTATTGTAGAFGVLLFKPLFNICVNDGVLPAGGFLSGNTFGGIPDLVDDACVSLLYCGQSTNAQGAGAILFAEH